MNLPVDSLYSDLYIFIMSAFCRRGRHHDRTWRANDSRATWMLVAPFYCNKNVVQAGLKTWWFPLNYKVTFSRSGETLARCHPLGSRVRSSHIPAVDFSSAAVRSAGCFHPTEALFWKRRKRKTSPVVTVRCVSSRRGRKCKNERESGWGELKGVNEGEGEGSWWRLDTSGSVFKQWRPKNKELK